MKKITSLCLAMVMSAVVLIGCGTQDSELVTKTPFPEFSETDMEGNTITNDMFGEYEVTIVNFWNNGCGTCIAEMPDLEELYQDFQDENINLIGVGADSGENQEQFELAKSILQEKGVTYRNISPNPDHSFYQDFVSDLTGYPTTYIVDKEGNMVGAPLIGDVKNQMDTLEQRIEQIMEMQEE